MADIQITTTQNVNLSFKLAELNHRVFAYLIDLAVKYTYVGLCVYFVSWFFDFNNWLDGFSRDYWSAMAIAIILMLPYVFYTLVLEVLFNGQTIGKKILKIKVLKIEGYQTSFVDFFIRWVMRIVDINMMSGVLAMIFIGSSKKQQRLGGIASGTVVVNLNNKINISHTILEENIEFDYKPSYLSVVKLSDNDVRIVKENYDKAQKNNDHALFLKLGKKVEAVIGEEKKEKTVSEFLETVIKDYNFLTQKM